MATYNPIFSKRLVVGVGIALFLLLGSVFLINFFTNEDSTNTTAEEEKISSDTRGLDAQRVFIKDFHKHDTFISSEMRYAIERNLYINTVMDKDFDHSEHYASDSSSHDSDHASTPASMLDLYTGTIRPNSFSDTSSGSSRSVKMLVDIEPAKLTYEVLVVEQNINNRPSKSFYISCAPQEQAVDTTVKCMQGAS